MAKLIGLIVLQLGSYISFLGLYLTAFPFDQPRPTWHIVLILAGLSVSLYLSYHDIREYLRSTPKQFQSPQQINAYMRSWLQSGGRAVIFTRDMSWAHDEEVREILLQKAARNELTICVEHPIPLANELANAGATVVSYAALGHVPRSRFTIIDFEREGARVAVGGKVHGTHVIQEFQSGQHPIFAIADDLAKILIAYSRRAHVPYSG
jgi:hypothetical protein